MDYDIPLSGQNINDLEKAKFEKKSDDLIYVRTTGDFSQSGLKNDLQTTCFLVTDIETPIPPTALIDRNTILFRNHSLTNTVYIGPSGVTADRNVGSTTSGYEVDPNSTFSIDVKANPTTLMYAICETGKTAICKTLEAS
ncbi:MAG: hypothetical protein ACP5N7_02000 [Candidatus Pacearchaeota archaeon]